MSLRATGEGHISSVVFRTGIVDLQGEIILDTSGGYSTVYAKKQMLYMKRRSSKNMQNPCPGF